MTAPWTRRRARLVNAGYRDGYAAGLRDAQRLAAHYRAGAAGAGAATVARELAELAHAAQLTADVAKRP